ncbi:MAG: hypothetical protein H7124_14070 [Phycisphaerales bacterium]|nr:hypothetical protein [Hyphomonadaceae bacterium]
MKVWGLSGCVAAVVFAAFTTAAMAQEDTPSAQAGAVQSSEAAPALEAPADPAATTDAAGTPDTAAAAPEATDPAADAAPAEPPGRIIFFRPGRLTGAVYTYHVVEVAEDGDSTRESPRIGSLPNGQYFEYAAPAGVHNYNIRGPMAVNLDEDRLRIEVEPGETYYIEQTVRMGLLTGGFRLVPSTLAEFERRRLREWTPRESDADELQQPSGSN